MAVGVKGSEINTGSVSLFAGIAETMQFNYRCGLDYCLSLEPDVV